MAQVGCTFNWLMFAASKCIGFIGADLWAILHQMPPCARRCIVPQSLPILRPQAFHTAQAIVEDNNQYIVQLKQDLGSLAETVCCPDQISRVFYFVCSCRIFVIIDCMIMWVELFLITVLSFLMCSLPRMKRRILQLFCPLQNQAE